MSDTTTTSEELREAPFWEGDEGTLSFDARRALLRLVRGPSLDAERHPALWKALLGSLPAISARLNELFLELVVDQDAGIAFVRNVEVEGLDVPKAVRTQPLTLGATLLVLFLRRELLGNALHRAIIAKSDAVEALEPYRLATDLDEAGFRRQIEGAWNKLVEANILLRTDAEDRYEISPVLRLVFGVEECRAVEEAFARLLEERGGKAPASFAGATDDPRSQEDGELEDLGDPFGESAGAYDEHGEA